MTTFNRRDVLKASALLPAALLPACNKSEPAASGSAPAASASAGLVDPSKPEVTDLRFGIIAKLRQRWVKYRDARRPAWQLDITDAHSILAFAGEIGMHGKDAALHRAATAVAARRHQSNVDLVPADVWSLIDKAKGAMSWAELARRTGCNASNSHVGKRGISRLQR